MQLRMLTIFFFALVTLSCSPSHNPGNGLAGAAGDGGNGGGSGKTEGGIRFSDVVELVFKETGCLDCHKPFTNHAFVIQRLVTPGMPETSRLYLRASTDMPPIEDGYLPLTEEQLNLIKDWILQGALE